ncbi:hypothetical protein C12CBH8_05000 [Solibaculum mannosilyticum]|uniref:Uncharacterized protein n=1 Tax=Solibaculum mannosilyticum TaxID=2780922 RepID=A0A7I8CZD8_9FIRM|nr:hypothetical protein C12CBH8_05000 [Solibaculum mannosilyticum]
MTFRILMWCRRGQCSVFQNKKPLVSQSYLQKQEAFLFYLASYASSKLFTGCSI